MNKKVVNLIFLVLILVPWFNISGVEKKYSFNELLIEFSKSIKPEYMSKNWAKKYKKWAISLSTEKLSLNGLKKAILDLDKNLNMDAYKAQHRKTVYDWPLYLSSANSIKSLTKILIKINSMLSKWCRTGYWKKIKNKWIKSARSKL